MTGKRRFGCSLALLALCAAAPAGAVNVTQRFAVTGPGEALEGDLILVAGRKIRLMGIDAPDLDQICRNRYGSPYNCGAIAKGVLAALVQGRTVTCVVADHDRMGLEMGECRVDGADLGAAMVARGWAFAYRSLSAAYQNAEAYAQSHRIGVWSGMVLKPWEWRTMQLRAHSK